jgi:hypothetical protein
MKPCDLKYLRRRIASIADKLSREETALDKAAAESAANGIAALSPLDIYLSDLQLMRRKS